MDAPFSITDLMERWHCSKDSVKKMEQEGKIKRNRMFGVFYTPKSVYDLENYGDKWELSLSDFHRLEKERDEWKDRAERAEKMLSEIKRMVE